MTIARLLLRTAQIWGETPALIDPARGRSISFIAMAQAAKGLGRQLRQRGLAVGDRVAILGDATPEYLCADYGIMSAGLVRVPLDPSLSVDELSNQIRDAEARLLLFDGERAQLAARLVEKAGAAGLDRLEIDEGIFDDPPAETLDALFGDEEIGLGALASLNYTGGTSGEPKAVMLGHDNLRAIVQNIVMARAMGPGDVMVNMRPLWPIAGIIVLAHLAAGGTVVLGGRFEPSRMIALLADHRAAATSMVPTHLVRMLRDCPPSTLRSLDALRSIDIGAASVPLETFEQALDAFGPKIGVLYGLTEASWSCYQPPSVLDAAPDVRRARMRSVGRPVFGCDIMIAGESAPALSGQSGEILIRGAHVMMGYWKRPDLTSQVLKDDWFGTGDLGIIDNNGIVSIVGRIKEVIRTGGKSVQPNEVEAALCRHPGVEEVSVVGIPNTEWGELVTAVVVLTPGADVSERALNEHCVALLSPHKRPKHIQIVRELPKSHYGKVQRSKVRAAAGEHYRDRTGEPPARNNS
jgi:acyl-CoA synthetase (AMP-forming)/AMP-acid ligase II